MAERNFTESMDKALGDAQFAQCMLRPILEMINEEGGFCYDDEEDAERASARIIALSRSAMHYSQEISKFLEAIELGGRSPNASVPAEG